MDPDPERFHSLPIANETEFCDLLECALGLTESDAEVYRHVLAHRETTAKEISRGLDCDPSTINRKLNTLHEKELVTRRRQLLSGGGIVYRYEPTSLDQIEEQMHQTINEWADSMHDRINSALQK